MEFRLEREEPLISRKRSWSKQQKRERRKRTAKLKRQEREALLRAMYGPSKKPAPVTVKRMDGTVVEKSQSQVRGWRASPMLENLAVDAGFASYTGYLHSAHWKGLRRRVLTRDGWRCRLCGSKKELQVHHDQYIDLMSDEIWHLKAMCRRCHQRIHR